MSTFSIFLVWFNACKTDNNVKFCKKTLKYAKTLYSERDTFKIHPRSKSTRVQNPPVQNPPVQNPPSQI